MSVPAPAGAVTEFTVVLFGVGWLAVAGYTYARARAEAESALSLQGVDPDAVPRSARADAARRNRLVAVAMALLGLGFLVAGLWL